ncbi:MAG: hypothetical protein KAJ09_08090 [Deltaproteobacteria bacterium]|nr:hypothetical protein [Deltaproteobacteria bacterium]
MANEVGFTAIAVNSTAILEFVNPYKLFFIWGRKALLKAWEKQKPPYLAFAE